MQTTLVILKPDCLAKRCTGEVIARFERAGFSLVGCKMMQLGKELMDVHYAHCVGQPFYPRLEAFMSGSSVIVLAIAGDNVVARVRELLGPTDSKKAAKGTIRGDFGLDITINIAHASDSEATAQIELARFFRPEELFGLPRVRDLFVERAAAAVAAP